MVVKNTSTCLMVHIKPINHARDLEQKSYYKAEVCSSLLWHQNNAGNNVVKTVGQL